MRAIGVMHMMPFSHAFAEFDAALERLHDSGYSQHGLDEAKHHLRLTLEVACDLPQGPKRPIEELILAVSNAAHGKRKVAVTLIRALAEPAVFGRSDSHLIISAIESGMGDVLQAFGYPERRAQTYEKRKILESCYSQMIEIIKPIGAPGYTLKEIATRRQEFIRVLSEKRLGWYLQQIGGEAVKAEVTTVFQLIDDVLKSQDAGLGSHLGELTTRVAEFARRRESLSVSIIRNSYDGFLKEVASASERYRAEAHERLQSCIAPASKDVVFSGKKCPLHEAGRIITVSVPLVNRGPSPAHDVKARLECATNEAAVNGEVSLGTVSVGIFQLSVQLMIIEPVEALKLTGSVSWRSLASAERLTDAWEMVLEGQNASVPWNELEQAEPYSTAIAEGSEFVGRSGKVLSIARRLLKSPMQSTFITGQKRVGKTSLAKAVVAYVEGQPEGGNYDFVYIEWGEYARPDPKATVEALGELMSAQMSQRLPVETRAMSIQSAGSLAPLVQLAKTAAKHAPERRFVFVLDEFDEIHPEMYRYGPLAEALFSNLRTLSSQKNIAFILVGGEKMPFVMRSQGDQLNKFVGESVSYFREESEWLDFRELVEKPVRGSLEWREDAIRKILSVSHGHPYYAKLLCGRVFQNAVTERDSDITVAEVERAGTELVADLDVNAFAHFWKDGIDGDKEEEEARALKRAKLLANIGRLMRLKRELTIETLAASASGFGLEKIEIQALVREFCSRSILREVGERLVFLVPMFGAWIEEVGADRIAGDTFAEDIARQIETEENAARVAASEVQELCEKWPPYQGQQITSDRVRSWLEQVNSIREQRLLFKLLQNVRFLSEFEIRKKLSLGYSMLVPHVPQFVRRPRADRRRDIIVTYLDGHGKSGHYYASRFAEENGISSECVMPADRLRTDAMALEQRREARISAVVICDDIAGTGETLAEASAEFIAESRSFLAERSAFVGIVVLTATVDGERNIRERIGKVQGVSVDLKVCELIDPSAFAFRDGHGFWKDEEEKAKAKALCRDLGAAVYKRSPLGYGDAGLLIVFPETTPNNSLPILFAQGTGERTWKPLFPRLSN